MIIIALILGAVAGGASATLVGDWRLAVAVGLIVAYCVAKPRTNDDQDQGEWVMVRREPERKRWF